MKQTPWGWENVIKYPQKVTRVNQNIPHLDDEEIKKLFTPITHINTDNQDVFVLLQKVIQHIHNLVKKEKTDNEYIEKHMGKLSARNILATGKTSYMNPCLDFVLVTIEWLKRSWIKDINLVIDELETQWWPHKIHFGIELRNKWTTYYIDYRFKNNVFIGKGDFESKYQEKWERVANKIKINSKYISIDDNMYTLVDKWLVLFKFFDIKILNILKQKLQNDNTDDQRIQWFVNQVKDIHQAEIAIEDKNSLIKMKKIRLDTTNMLNLTYKSLLQPTPKRQQKNSL